MIEILDETTAKCLVVHVSSKVTVNQYQKFLNALGERINTHEEVSLVLELSSFEFSGDFEAARNDVQFGLDQYKQIHRAAFVGNKKWIEWFTRLIAPFTRTEEKYFPETRLEEACAWACA